ncbi:MAG: DUF1501 domain-containing protein [Deltaproteobacteria bacterium]|nr:DUF1501 domain-containing protein [Deltaproteobacteria bacterium]
MTTRTLSRRGFLKGGCALGLGAAAFGGVRALETLARAASTGGAAAGVPDRHYIFCYFSGGWDLLLSLDPRDPQVFTNGNLATTRIQPAYEELATPPASPYRDVLRDGSMYLGPYVGELAGQASRLCVVRGMSMDTLTHEVGRRRFLTGRPPSGLQARGSSTDTWLAARLGADEPIPNLSIRVESFNVGDQPNYASALQTNGLDDLLRVLQPSGPLLGSTQDRELDELLAAAAACPEAEGSSFWQGAELSRQKATQMVSGGLFAPFDFRSNAADVVALRDHYGFTSSSAGLQSPGAMAAMAATAIMKGVSRAVSVRINSVSLDTHFDNWSTDQGPAQEAGFTAIARMMQHLQSVPYPDGSGASWLDRTVIVGFSEFMRTPMLNTNGGRDHWLANSCFLAGGDIAGGKVIGASSNMGMNPMPVDLATGTACALDADMVTACPEELGKTSIIRPEHILQALYHEVGVTSDEPDLRVPPLTALFRA